MLRRKFLTGTAGILGLLGAEMAHSPAQSATKFGSANSIAWQRLPRLNKGFNIPGWIGIGDDRAPATELLRKLRQLGFAAVRLPVDPLHLVSPNGAAIAGQAVSAAQTLQSLGYSVTFDMHPGAEIISLFASDPDAAQIYVEYAWDVLLNAASSLPAEITYFEILNEPPMDQDIWRGFGARLVAHIRAKVPGHTLLWGPARYQALWELEDASLPHDRNMIVAVHYYEPMSFTHQGADWAGPTLGALREVPFPGTSADLALTELKAEQQRLGNDEVLELLNRDFHEDWDVERIKKIFAAAGRWAIRNDRPLVLNEFGAYGASSLQMDRARWVRAVRSGAEDAGMAWTYWELDGGFGFLANRHEAQSLEFNLISALLDD